MQMPPNRIREGLKINQLIRLFLSRPPAIHLTQLDAMARFNLFPKTVIRHRLAIMRGAAKQR